MKSATLGNLCKNWDGNIQTGPFGSQLHQHDYRETGTPVVMPQDIIEDRISASKIARIDETKADQLSRHRLFDGDIVFPRRGDIGKRALIGPDQVGYLCGTGCMKISVPRKALNPKWLFYYLAQSHVVKWIENKAVGATMLNLNTSILGGVPVVYPDLVEQERIAENLATYDDLIETNRRRIALLEESARLLYREWFVKLRFPGHELVEKVDGVPAGWERQTLKQIAFLNYGKALKESERKEGEVPVYGSSGIVGRHNKALVPGPSIIVGRKGNVGSVYFSRNACHPIDTVYFISNQQTTYYLYLLLQTMNFISSDAAVPGLNREYAHRLPVLCPSPSILSHFEAEVDSLFQQAQSLQRMNNSAAQARDALLPKLMSGQLTL